jgi:sulfite exporter TauE/SafE
VLGAIGIGLGVAVAHLEAVESFRSDLAGWALFGFGLAYTVWGIRHAWRNRPHTHWHMHENGKVHEHAHGHHAEHAHVHEHPSRTLTPWVLFVIFVLGPCEPLIPILMYPAAQNSAGGLVLVTSLFGIATIATMIGITVLGVRGFQFVPARSMERYSHALAGFAIFLCGAAIQFLGL